MIRFKIVKTMIISTHKSILLCCAMYDEKQGIILYFFLISKGEWSEAFYGHIHQQNIDSLSVTIWSNGIQEWPPPDYSNMLKSL